MPVPRLTGAGVPSPACNRSRQSGVGRTNMMLDHLISRPAVAGATLAGALVLIAGLAMAETRKEAPKIGDPPEAMNVRLVGQNDLQGRTAYQPTVFKQGGRYIAYIGHHGGSGELAMPINRLSGQAELNGTSIVDVTDPKQ